MGFTWNPSRLDFGAVDRQTEPATNDARSFRASLHLTWLPCHGDPAHCSCGCLLLLIGG